MCMHACMHVFMMYCISRLPASVLCREAAAVSAGPAWGVAVADEGVEVE